MIVNYCVARHAGLCVVVLIRCLMRSRVVCGVVWLYVLLVAFVILFLCVPCLCVNVMVVIYCVMLYELCLCGCGCVRLIVSNVRVCCEFEFV